MFSAKIVQGNTDLLGCAIGNANWQNPRQNITSFCGSVLSRITEPFICTDVSKSSFSRIIFRLMRCQSTARAMSGLLALVKVLTITWRKVSMLETYLTSLGQYPRKRLHRKKTMNVVIVIVKDAQNLIKLCGLSKLIRFLSSVFQENARLEHFVVKLPRVLNVKNITIYAFPNLSCV